MLLLIVILSGLVVFKKLIYALKSPLLISTLVSPSFYMLLFATTYIGAGALGNELALTYARYAFYADFFSSIKESSIITTKALSTYTLLIFLVFELSIKPKVISFNPVYRLNPLIVWLSKVILILSGLYTALLLLINRSSLSSVLFRQDGLEIYSTLAYQLGIITFLLCVCCGVLILVKKSYILIPLSCAPLILIEILTQGRTLLFIMAIFFSIAFISSTKTSSLPSVTNTHRRLQDLATVRNEASPSTSSSGSVYLTSHRLMHSMSSNRGAILIYASIAVVTVLIIGIVVFRTAGAFNEGYGFIGFLFFADVIYSFWSTPIAIDYYNFNSYSSDIMAYMQNAFIYMIPSFFLNIFSGLVKHPLAYFAQTLYDVYDNRLGFGLATNIVSEAYIAGGISFCYLSPIIIASILRLVEKFAIYRSVAGYIFVMYFCSYTRLIVRDNFYISFFSLIGLMVFLGSWIFVLQPRTDFSKPTKLRVQNMTTFRS